MANQNENDVKNKQIDIDANLEDLEKILQENLEKEFSDAEFLEEQISEIANPESLGTVVYDTIWEQVRNQIGVQAGEDFIKDNYGQNLDLRASAHIQTTENFANGKIANHNHEINYQERYDDWQSNFQKDPNSKSNPSKNERYNEDKKVWEKQDNRTKEWKAEELKELDLDAYLLGSDQIWSSFLMGALDPVYFGAFKTKEKIISYAASLANGTIPSEEETAFSTLTRNRSIL